MTFENDRCSQQAGVQSSGAYGRFRYAPAISAFVVVNRTGGPTCAYRL